MKTLLTAAAFFIAINTFAQSADSVQVRICNKGRYYIKECAINLNGKTYKFFDIWKGKYSSYQKLPYIYTNNGMKLTVVRKRLLNYDEWITTMLYPIDHIGENKIASGKAAINIITRKKHKQLKIEQQVITE